LAGVDAVKPGHGDLDWDQSLSDRIDTKAQAFKGHRTQQCWGSIFPEDDEGRRLAAIIVKLSLADATQASSAIRIDGGPLIKMRDSQRIKNIRGELAVRCSSVHKAFNRCGPGRIERIKHCDLYVECSHTNILPQEGTKHLEKKGRWGSSWQEGLSTPR
jgi:hypothetical protein